MRHFLYLYISCKLKNRGQSEISDHPLFFCFIISKYRHFKNVFRVSKNAWHNVGLCAVQKNKLPGRIRYSDSSGLFLIAFCLFVYCLFLAVRALTVLVERSSAVHAEALCACLGSCCLTVLCRCLTALADFLLNAL